MCETLTLRVHALMERSFANGPGCRAVIWTQGCTIRCPGCFNPEAQDHGGGSPMSVSGLAAWVRSIKGLDGLTLSGGEPLQQPDAVAALLREVRDSTRLTVVLFTGYDWHHVTANPGLLDVARLADVVVAGPFRRWQRLGYALLGSANQSIHLLTNRYSLADLEAVPTTELVLDEGAAVLTGITDVTLT